jgi:hypothetical protein
MREALVILVVMVILLALTAVRYRKQIAGMIHIWRALKSARDQIKGAQIPKSEAQPAPAGQLVNCAKCGNWVPEQSAINLRGGTFYCSTACLESSAKVG